jgi:DNA-binding FadR family transcriptional regulator
VTAGEHGRPADVEGEEPYATALEFHNLLVDMSDNPVITLFTHCLQAQGIEVHHEHLLSADDQRNLDVVHDAIARAIIAGDPMQTELLMREHMLHYRSLFMARWPALLDTVVSWRAFNQ